VRVANRYGIMSRMTEDRTTLQWAKLAAAIRAAREARGLTQSQLAELAGISEGSVQNLESGNPRSRMPQTLVKVEPHLGWAAGSGRIILDGGEPIAAPSGAAATAASRVDDRLRRKLPLRVVDELESDDPLIDSQVIQLPGTDGARMTVVVHGRPDATPEEIQEALLAWRRAERKLHRLPDDDDDDDGKPKAAHGS
jgi:transcriptional regulator with XRE-family HTH domain